MVIDVLTDISRHELFGLACQLFSLVGVLLIGIAGIVLANKQKLPKVSYRLILAAGAVGLSLILALAGIQLEIWQYELTQFLRHVGDLAIGAAVLRMALGVARKEPQPTTTPATAPDAEANHTPPPAVAERPNSPAPAENATPVANVVTPSTAPSQPAAKEAVTNNRQSQENAAAPRKSYVGAAVLTLLLYYFGFYVIGLIVNICYMFAYKKDIAETGRRPDGAMCIYFLFLTHFFLPALVILLSVVFGFGLLSGILDTIKGMF